MINVYMDASGTHDDSHNCIIGGYWGNVDAWTQFEEAWSAILASEGIDEFHASVFWFRHGESGEIRKKPYQGWNHDRDHSFINRLLEVIEDVEIYPFAIGVLNADWQTFPDLYKPLLTGQTILTSQTSRKYAQRHLPQLFALTTVVIRIMAYVEQPIRVHFVFDNDDHKGDLKRAFDGAKELIRFRSGEPLVSRMGALVFDDSKIATPLQAADLLAYEAHRFVRAGTFRDEYRRAIGKMRDRDASWLYDGSRLNEFKKVFDSLIYDEESKHD